MVSLKNLFNHEPDQKAVYIGMTREMFKEFRQVFVYVLLWTSVILWMQ